MLNIVKANKNDLDEIQLLVKENQKYLKDNGIPQWINGYPDNNILLDDINHDGLFIVKDDDKLIGMFAKRDYEETYDVIDGKWLSDTPYVVIHRLAISNEYKRKGITTYIFNELKKNHSHIRVDTHELNKGMNSCLIKNDFKYCGIIKLKDNSLRNAYEYII